MTSHFLPSEVLSAAAACVETGEALLNEALGLQEPQADHTSILRLPNFLCEQCRSIFSETRVFRLNRRRSDADGIANLLLLRRDEPNNCRLCKILLYRLEDGSESSSAQSETLKVKFWLVNDPMFLYGSYNLRFETRNSEGVTLKKFKLLLAALELGECPP